MVALVLGYGCVTVINRIDGVKIKHCLLLVVCC